MIRQSVRAQQEIVTCFDRKRSFNIDLNHRIGTKAASNHVAWMKQFHILRSRFSKPNHFPLKAVIKRQLLDHSIADSIDAAVTNMANDRATIRLDGGLHDLIYGGGSVAIRF